MQGLERGELLSRRGGAGEYREGVLGGPGGGADLDEGGFERDRGKSGSRGEHGCYSSKVYRPPSVTSAYQASASPPVSSASVISAIPV